ncbi:MAG: heparan-alpha-glucosaminide N-acetyltransferase domain-containing protein [Coriobacteriia bacterium]|nr:heparan-alpha-glucosaminide N-acetyltransferase domain-containing protein [Coriobacteriia bacterium]
MSQTATDNPNGRTISVRATQPRHRILSLDAFRGATIALMIFMDHPTFPAGIPLFLRHPEWHGFRLPDYVFPAFIFIAGVSMAYSTRKRDVSFAKSTAGFARREVLLFALGLMLNYFKYGLPLRIMGVLQRIALSMAIVWPFTRLKARWAVIGAAVLLVGYAAIFLFAAPAGIPAGSTSAAPNITGWVDTTLLGLEHTYKQSGLDPEGLLGTLPAAALGLIGLAMGLRLIDRPQDPLELLLIGSYGAALVGIALWAHRFIPINKKLWTSSFTLVSAGLSLVVLAVLYYLVDIRGYTRGAKWFVPLGRNALFIYIASNMLVVAGKQWITVDFEGTSTSLWVAVSTALARVVGLGGASLVISAAEVVLWLGVAALMHRRKWHVKL